MKFYENNEHAPLIKGPEQGPTLVLLKSPPPILHTVKLGPVNDLLGHIEKLGSSQYLTTFYSSIHITKSSYQKCVFEGNEVSKILNNLDALELILPPKFRSFVKALRALKFVFTAYSDTYNHLYFCCLLIAQVLNLVDHVYHRLHNHSYLYCARRIMVVIVFKINLIVY